MRTDRELIQMAREAGLPETSTEGVFIVNTDDLGRLLAAEREACAKVCDEREIPNLYGFRECANAIRNSR